MFGNVTYHDFAEALCEKLRGAESLCGLRISLLWKDGETAYLSFEEVVCRKENYFSCELDLSDYYCLFEDLSYSFDELVIDIQENVKSIWNFQVYRNLSEFEQCKRKIFPRVLGVKQNSAHRFQYEHIDMSGLDLMVTYYVETRRGITCAKKEIDYQDLQKWGISLEDLHKYAIANMRREREIQFISLGKYLKSRMQAINERVYKDNPIPEVLIMTMFPEDCPVWIYQFKDYPFGATAILFEDKLQEIHKNLGDFCMVPSSTEEFLIIPTEKMEGMEDLVKGMNGLIGSGLVLSDNLYMVTENGIEVVNE